MVVAADQSSGCHVSDSTDEPNIVGKTEFGFQSQWSPRSVAPFQSIHCAIFLAQNWNNLAMNRASGS